MNQSHTVELSPLLLAATLSHQKCPELLFNIFFIQWNNCMNYDQTIIITRRVTKETGSGQGYWMNNFKNYLLFRAWTLIGAVTIIRRFHHTDRKRLRIQLKTRTTFYSEYELNFDRAVTIRRRHHQAKWLKIILN